MTTPSTKPSRLVSAGNLATAGIFTLLAVLVVLQASREPRPAAPAPRPSAVAATDQAAQGPATAPPMRAVILPPPPEFRATPRALAPAEAPLPRQAPPPPPSVQRSARSEPPAAPAATPSAPPPTSARPAPPAVPAAAPPPPRTPSPAGGAMVRIDPADASETLARGRVLLRLLEHGRGPAIEIAWPSDESGHTALYRLLAQCYGMQVALLDRDGRLLAGSGGTGPGQVIDLDRFSGFVREPKGVLPAEEAQRGAELRARYPGSETSRVVRVFPRQVDAALVAGLRQILGERYDSAATIVAGYRRRGAELSIEEIVVDGAAVPGRIVLMPSRDAPCGEGS